MDPSDGEYQPNAGNLLRDAIAGAGGVQGLHARFERAGLTEHVHAWIGHDARPVSARDIEQVFPPERLDQLARAHAIPAGLVSALLAQLLPHAVGAAGPDRS